MNKVKLPKEVAEAIAYLRKEGFSDYSIITSADGKESICSTQFLTINNSFGQDKMHPDEFIKALVNGYEVEETPEDKVREFFIKYDESNGEYSRGSRNAVVEILDLLNIKIEGVNT